MPEQPGDEVIVVAEHQSDGSTVVEVIEIHGQPEASAEAGDSGDAAEILEAILDGSAEVGDVEVHEYIVLADGEVTDGEGGHVVEALPVEEEAVPSAEHGMEATSHDAPSSSQETRLTQVELEEKAEQEGHSQAAQHAQERADADIAAGDYHAAAHERESAESQAWEASDSSMLHGSSAVELEAAADRQQDAQHFEHEEAQHAAAGDYAAARDDAANAANQQDWADYYAGGSDHTGQAHAEYAKEDNAVWQEGQAHQAAQDAQWFAEHGDAGVAENYAHASAEHQAQADQYGLEGQHGSEFAVHDPSSDVAHDTPVGDASADAAAHTEDAMAHADDGSAHADDGSAHADDGSAHADASHYDGADDGSAE